MDAVRAHGSWDVGVGIGHVARTGVAAIAFEGRSDCCDWLFRRDMSALFQWGCPGTLGSQISFVGNMFDD